MSDCCSSNSSNLNKASNKHICPSNNQAYSKVATKTIWHHLKEPWKVNALVLDKQSYFFCDDPDCDTVYFAEDNTEIKKSEIRINIGIKEPTNSSALVCYCFGVTMQEATKNTEIRDFVVQKTKEQVCACDTRNPSGRCCLKDFPK